MHCITAIPHHRRTGQLLHLNDLITYVTMSVSAAAHRCTVFPPSFAGFWWIYYYPAQEGMGLCLTLGDTELAMCSPEVKDLLDLRDARESGNNQTLTDTVDRIVNSTRALYAQRLNVDRTYNPKQGCNANVPVR
jgi:hypothetical protein